MTIEIDDSYEIQLHKECIEFLKSRGYTFGEYTLNHEVEAILLACFEFLYNKLISEFEEFKNPNDVFFFFHFYDHKEAHDDLTLIFKDICRHLFAYVPFLSLKSTETSILTPLKISKLWFISKDLRHITQTISISKIFDGNTFYFYITQNGYNITIQDENVADLLDNFNKANQLGLRRPYCDDFPNQKAFIDGIIDYFEPISQSLWDKVITNNPNRNIFIDGLENLTEEEFCTILKGFDNSIPKGVVRVSDIVNLNYDHPFIASLILDKSNANLQKSLVSPHQESFRTRYKPIVQIQIDDEKEYLTTGDILFEALSEIATSQFVHNKLPEEWIISPELKILSDAAFHSHSKLLEDTIGEVLEANNIFFLKNVSSINNIDLEDKNTTFFLKKMNRNFVVGEIDFIIINFEIETIFVVDAKFLKPRNHFQGYNADINTFIKNKGYNDRMNIKVGWIENHITDLKKHCKKEIDNFKIKGAFVTDNFTFYSLFSEFPIIPAVKFVDYVKTGNPDYLNY